MFERSVSYPTAVTSDDDEGVDAAIDWCRERLEEQDTLSVWTSRKADLANCSQLERLVSAHSNVEHVTGRGGTVIRTGPVLMAWPDMEDIGELLRSGGPRIRALCVVTWHDDAIRPWVSAVEPELLGDSTAWQQLTPSLDPVVAEAMKSLTRRRSEEIRTEGAIRRRRVTDRSPLLLTRCEIWCGDTIVVLPRV